MVIYTSSKCLSESSIVQHAYDDHVTILHCHVLCSHPIGRFVYLSSLRERVLVWHTHTHTHTHTHVHTHTYIHTHVHPHTYTRTHTCTHTYIHTQTYIHTYIHTQWHTYTHMHTYIYTDTHVHTHTYTHTRNGTILNVIMKRQYSTSYRQTKVGNDNIG